jgi:hypothetical protein
MPMLGCEAGMRPWRRGLRRERDRTRSANCRVRQRCETSACALWHWLAHGPRTTMQRSAQRQRQRQRHRSDCVRPTNVAPTHENCTWSARAPCNRSHTTIDDVDERQPSQKWWAVPARMPMMLATPRLSLLTTRMKHRWFGQHPLMRRRCEVARAPLPTRRCESTAIGR